MTENILYTYTVESNYCSDLAIVSQYELGISNDFQQDIHNVYANAETDKEGQEYLLLRT